MLKNEWDADHLDVRAFARAAGELAGRDALRRYERLMAETQGRGGDLPVAWRASGELQAVPGAADQVWLTLSVEAVLPLVCQRCLGPVEMPVNVQRRFRFVADEATAEAEDDEAEEDVLVLSRAFDLRGLVEDEVLMALPLVPRHEACPTEVTLSATDADFEQAEDDKPNPFAALAGLRGKGEPPSGN